ncbi:MAG: NAD(P)H-hydrate epimerase [Halobacteriales archaeon]
MTGSSFRTPAGRDVTAVTAGQMADVDRVAVEDVGLQLLQMMENAGRALAHHARDARDEVGDVLVVAGNGGNGGGGMACARHLANRDVPVSVLLDRPPADLAGAAAHQHGILAEMGVPHTTDVERLSSVGVSAVVVDALIGYGLAGEVQSPAREYIEATNDAPGPVVSLDVPSGVDATTGETLGSAVRPDRTVTLALPKIGLDAVSGTLYLADIGIPETVYDRLDITYESPFGEHDWIVLERC